MNPRRPRTLAALLAAFALSSSPNGLGAADVQPLTVQTVPVKKGEATRSITLPASVAPYQQATLFAKVTGYLKTVAVDKGDSVKQGDLLAEIEVPELIAEGARQKAELEIAALDFRRASEAQAKAPDLVVAQSVDTAKSKVEIAKANLERTETLLSFTKIIAPFSGIITRRFVDPGAFVPAATANAGQGAALFTVMDFSKVRVQVPVPEPEVPSIRPGEAASVRIEELPGSVCEGTVTRHSFALDEATRTMLAEIELPNPNAQLRPGMYARVRIVVERKPGVLVIPSAALVSEKTGSSVFTVADGKARRLIVKTGFNDGGWVEITEGLAVDQPVILVGKQAPVDGQPVVTAEAK